MAEEGKGRPKLTYLGESTSLVIQNPYPDYHGYLAPLDPPNGKFMAKLGWTDTITKNNLCTVYYYASVPLGNNAGAYVVLQFEESNGYVFARKNGSIFVLKANFWKKQPPDITDPTDPRVFLMKHIILVPHHPAAADVVFVWHGNDNDGRVTLVKDPPNSTELEPEEIGGRRNAQRFRLYKITFSANHDDRDPSEIPEDEPLVEGLALLSMSSFKQTGDA